jgi:hypothetical protein
MDEFTHPIILRRKRRGIKPEVIQLTHYCEFLEIMDITFGTGETPENFPVVMYKNGAAISACWQNGVLPMFSVCE